MANIFLMKNLTLYDRGSVMGRRGGGILTAMGKGTVVYESPVF